MRAHGVYVKCRISDSYFLHLLFIVGPCSEAAAYQQLYLYLRICSCTMAFIL